VIVDAIVGVVVIVPCTTRLYEWPPDALDLL
jgi:hypothetical protein